MEPLLGWKLSSRILWQKLIKRSIFFNQLSISGTNKIPNSRSIWPTLVEKQPSRDYIQNQRVTFNWFLMFVLCLKLQTFLLMRIAPSFFFTRTQCCNFHHFMYLANLLPASTVLKCGCSFWKRLYFHLQYTRHCRQQQDWGFHCLQSVCEEVGTHLC